MPNRFWRGQKLGYIDARHQISLLYQDLVKQTRGYAILKSVYEQNGEVTLFDFDGYDHQKLGMTLHQVLNNPTRICGHAFILAMMLTYGDDFTPADLTPVV